MLTYQLSSPLNMKIMDLKQFMCVNVTEIKFLISVYGLRSTTIVHVDSFNISIFFLDHNQSDHVVRLVMRNIVTLIKSFNQNKIVTNGLIKKVLSLHLF